MQIKKWRPKLKGADIIGTIKAGCVWVVIIGYCLCRLPVIRVTATQMPLAITTKAPIITEIKISNSIFHAPDLCFSIQCPSAYARSAAPMAGIIISGGISTSEGCTYLKISHRIIHSNIAATVPTPIDKIPARGRGRLIQRPIINVGRIAGAQIV